MQLGARHAESTHPDRRTTPAPRLTETARIASQGGVARLTVMDHLRSRCRAWEMEVSLARFLAEMEACAALCATVVTTGPAGDGPAAWTTRVSDEVLPRLEQL